MKTETKIVQRTKGKWEFDGLEIIKCNGKVIADIRSCNHDGEEIENQVFNINQDEAKANAEYICDAANNYSILLEENKRLREALRDSYDFMVSMWNKLPASENNMALPSCKMYFDKYMAIQIKNEQALNNNINLQK